MQLRNPGRYARILFRSTTFTLALIGVGQSAHAGDYLLDPNYTGTNGAPSGQYAGVYNTIVAALASTGSINSGASAINPNRLFIEPGTYNTANVTGVSLSNSKSNIALIGMTGNPDDVVITSTLDAAYNPGSGAIGTTGSATMQLKGNNVSATGITFGNSTDTPYIVSTAHQAVSPQGSYATGQSQTATSQAVALLLQGDEQAFSNCKFLGYQDTLYTKGGRTYFKNCTVSGDIDYIFANGTDVFKNSTINMDGDHVNGTVTAASTDKRTSNGLVFLNSTITGNSVHGNPVIDGLNAANVNGPAAGTMYLGRPWGWQQTGGDAGTVYVNTKMAPAINATGWMLWNSNETIAGNAKNGGDPTQDARYAEYNSMDLSGNPLDVSSRAAWSHQFTSAQEAAAYNETNLFSYEGPAQYPWFGSGYTGSSDPTNPNFSWPAFWGTRNAQNDLSNELVPGNPTAYSDPSWTVAGAWDPNAQLALVPEPGSLGLMASALGLLVGRRRARRDVSETNQSRGKVMRTWGMFLIVSLILMSTMATRASAALIDVDFSPGGSPAQSGAAVLGTAGDVWNNFTAGSGTAAVLNDTTGTPTTATLTFTENFGGNNTAGSPMDAATTNLMQDYGGFNGTTIAIAGLSPSTSYTLALYGAGDQAAGDQGTKFTLPGGVIGMTTETSAGAGSRRISDGAGVAYTLLTASSDGGGNLNIAVAFNSTHFSTAPVNGFQIQPAVTPEPASLGLLGLAGAAMLRRRRVVAMGC